jgi:hypothetical protein
MNGQIEDKKISEKKEEAFELAAEILKEEIKLMYVADRP